MLPSIPNFAPQNQQPRLASSSFTTFGGGSGAFLSQQQQQQVQDPLLQGADPNSPEIFKSNIQSIQQDISELQKHARNVLSSIQNAYQYGNSPVHTEAEITALKTTLHHIVERLRQSGVGALPIISQSKNVTIRNEQQLLAEMTENLRSVYSRLQRSQEGAAIVSNLLTTEYSARAQAPK